MLRTRNMIKFFGAVIIILAAFVTLIYPLANSIKQGLDFLLSNVIDGNFE